MGLIPSKENYVIDFVDYPAFTNISYSAELFDLLPGDYVFVTHKFQQKPDRQEIRNVFAIQRFCFNYRTK